MAPTELVAVTVYVAAAVNAAGVPVIAPVDVLKLKPVGNPGEMLYVGAGAAAILGNNPSPDIGTPTRGDKTPP